MAIAEALANSVLDALVNGTDLIADTSIYLSIHVNDPADTGANECTDGTYARVDVSSSFSAAGAKSVTNDVAIEFPAATTGFTAKYVGLNGSSGSSGGTWYLFGAVTPNKTVGAGEILRFAAGQLTLSLA